MKNTNNDMPFTFQGCEEFLDRDGVWMPVSAKKRKKRSVQIVIYVNQRTVKQITSILRDHLSDPGWKYNDIIGISEDENIRMHIHLREDTDGYKKFISNMKKNAPLKGKKKARG